MRDIEGFTVAPEWRCLCVRSLCTSENPAIFVLTSNFMDVSSWVAVAMVPYKMDLTSYAAWQITASCFFSIVCHLTTNQWRSDIRKVSGIILIYHSVRSVSWRRVARCCFGGKFFFSQQMNNLEWPWQCPLFQVKKVCVVHFVQSMIPENLNEACGRWPVVTDHH